jgi:hypothetical protein
MSSISREPLVVFSLLQMPFLQKNFHSSMLKNSVVQIPFDQPYTSLPACPVSRLPPRNISKVWLVQRRSHHQCLLINGKSKELASWLWKLVKLTTGELNLLLVFFQALSVPCLDSNLITATPALTEGYGERQKNLFCILTHHERVLLANGRPCFSSNWRRYASLFVSGNQGSY